MTVGRLSQAADAWASALRSLSHPRGSSGLSIKLEPGTFGIASGELARYTTAETSIEAFYASAAGSITQHRERGHSIATNRNRIVEAMVGNYVVWMDDDHVFSPEILHRLIAQSTSMHAIMAAPYVTRRPPFDPVVFRPVDGNPLLMQSVGWGAFPRQKSGLWTLPLGWAVGGAGIVVRREVYDRIGFPWYSEELLARHGIGDDLFFCKRAAECGIPITLDLSLWGWEHLTTVGVRPDFDPVAGWGIAVNFGGGMVERFEAFTGATNGTPQIKG